jgi:glycosyltransferase involved in cell wall biosynthesis
MVSSNLPLVSIVTPVYNNEEHFVECIESVLAQTYQNWDYTIVNNCSTDSSAEIARRYAAKDPRIRVHENDRFLRAIPNHNLALRQISPESKYAKMVFADDWLFPRCVEDMVAVAEENPSVGIVGAYGLWEVADREPHQHVVKWGGLMHPARRVSGREICRCVFLEGLDVFGTATSLLYRSDLVRSKRAFFNEDNFHADRDVCIEMLKGCDLGFVHQVLTFTRGRPGSLNKFAVDMYWDIGCALQTLVTHGPDVLTPEEFVDCLEKHLAKYYNFLAVSAMRGRRDETFWNFHRKKLEQTVGFDLKRFVRAFVLRLIKAGLNPAASLVKIRRLIIDHHHGRHENDKFSGKELSKHATELGG